MNLRTTFGKIIAKAGVKPWPRLFHNMRALCACDWSEWPADLRVRQMPSLMAANIDARELQLAAGNDM